MTHAAYMRRAIQLAKLGGKSTRSNPNVGAVIVHHNRIIGEGYHAYYGGPHAERVALAAVSEADRPLLAQSTLYVTLEPCNHHGKTPPCSEAVLAAGIPRLVVGVPDPSPHLSGRSCAALAAQGIQVTVGVEAKACEQLLRPFVVQLREQRPYVYLKQAQSADGWVGKRGEQLWITNEQSRAVSHDLRDRVDAIMVGTETVIIDNPSLTTRAVVGEHPLRVVLDRQGRIPLTHQIYTDAYPCLTISSYDRTMPKDRLLVTAEEWEIGHILRLLRTQGISHLLVEGGRTLQASLLKDGLWDEAWIFKGGKHVNGDIAALNIEGELLDRWPCGSDEVLRILRDQ